MTEQAPLPLPQDEQDLIVARIRDASQSGRIDWHRNEDHDQLYAYAGDALLTLRRGSEPTLTVTTHRDPSPRTILTAVGTGDVRLTRTLAITKISMQNSDALSFALKASQNTTTGPPEDQIADYLATNMALATLAGILPWHRMDTVHVTAFTTVAASTHATLTIARSDTGKPPHKTTLTVSGPRGPLAVLHEHYDAMSSHRTPLGQLVEAITRAQTDAAHAAAAAALDRTPSEITLQILSPIAWPPKTTSTTEPPPGAPCGD